MITTLVQLVEQVRDDQVLLENLYPEAVTAQGNTRAWQTIMSVFEPADVRWRGLGELPQSGLCLREEFSQFHAIQRFNLQVPQRQETPGCRCGDVITARCTPPECKLFEKVCTPVNPLGPCMVSGEGTCQAWFKYHRGTIRKAFDPQPVEAS